MKIPKTFEILGHRVTVRWDSEITEDSHGKWNAGRSVIRLQSPSDDWTRAMAEHTFCHELTHCILDLIGEEKLSKNEKFVDLFGGTLAQVLKTMKGEL